jgi:glycosyltransferase involved in cell wall biosynthesis
MLQLNSDVDLTLIIPVYNESELLLNFVNFIKSILNIDKLHINFLFINDGSTDDSLAILLKMKQFDSRISIVDFSRNFGKESALTAGLKFSKGDIVIPIDVDLQDPPEIIPQMIEKWLSGSQIVLAKRINRDSDSFLKRFFSYVFYAIHRRIVNFDIPTNVGDFRLLDRSVVDALNSMHENNRYMKGLFSWVGFSSSYVYFTRQPRSKGNSKFNFLKLLNLAIEGITSFSIFPLRIFSIIGLLISIFSFSYAFYIIYLKIFFQIDIPGFSTMIVMISFLGGFNLLGIGVLGEYVGKIYFESKKRPIYIIRDVFK